MREFAVAAIGATVSGMIVGTVFAIFLIWLGHV